MTYEDRKRQAIANVRAKIDEGRESREWDHDEATSQVQADVKETARYAEADPLSELACESPGYRRAVANVRERLRERDDALEAAQEGGAPDELDGLCGSTKSRGRQSSPAQDFFDDGDGDFDE